MADIVNLVAAKGGALNRRALGFFALSVAVVSLQIFDVNVALAQRAVQPTQAISEASMSPSSRTEANMITEKSKAECTLRVTGFIEELEKMFVGEHSVYPIQGLFKKYFPLEGCEPDKVLEICRKSKYCKDSISPPDIIVLAFDSRPNDPHRGFYVQFGLDPKSGNSQLPFVKVKI